MPTSRIDGLNARPLIEWRGKKMPHFGTMQSSNLSLVFFCFSVMPLSLLTCFSVSLGLFVEKKREKEAFLLLLEHGLDLLLRLGRELLGELDAVSNRKFSLLRRYMMDWHSFVLEDVRLAMLNRAILLKLDLVAI